MEYKRDDNKKTPTMSAFFASFFITVSRQN